MERKQIRPNYTWGWFSVRAIMLIALAVGSSAASKKKNGYIVGETKNSTSLILFHRKCLTKPEVELRKQLDESHKDEMMADDSQQRQLRSIVNEVGFADEMGSIEDVGKIADIHQARVDAMSAQYSRKLFGGISANADGSDDYQADEGLSEDAPKVTKVLTEVELSSKRKRRLERKRQRTLKRKQRRKRKKNRKKDIDDFPPWHCQMKTEWLRMPEGYFPQYVQTGQCTESKCMFGMYRCRAKRYVIRVLRKNPLRCNPLPQMGHNSTYEEAWEVLKYKITIGCECTLMNSKKNKSKKKHKQQQPKKQRGHHGLGAVLPGR